MSRALDRVVEAARETTPDWNEERASRVLGAALAKKDRRAKRDRVLRRGAVAGVVVASFCVLLLRAASAASPSSESPPATDTVASHEVALGDAGYARD